MWAQVVAHKEHISHPVDFLVTIILKPHIQFMFKLIRNFYLKTVDTVRIYNVFW